ncbi:Cholecystokinin receptor type A [Nymphon striatum]|nr:Cholecystokinin receptor type A [Nymphon striatum]
MSANLSLLNAMVSDFLNCFNGSGCNHNATSEVTESSPSLLEPSNETYIYFDRPEEMLIPWKINPYFIPVMVTYAFTFIAGVLGNIIVICFMIGDMKKNLTQVFLISLAVADLLLLLICVPLDVAKYLVIELDKDGVVCKLMSFAEMLSAFASVLNLAAVSLERFIVIVFPLRARSYCTLGNVCKSLVFVWSCSIMLAIPFTISKLIEGNKSSLVFPFNSHKKEDVPCEEITENTYTNHVVTVTLYLCYDRGGIGRFILSIYTLIALFVLPFIVMIICYAKVICELWLSTKKVKTLTEHKNKNKKSSYVGYTARNLCQRIAEHNSSVTGSQPYERQAWHHVIKFLRTSIYSFKEMQ